MSDKLDKLIEVLRVQFNVCLLFSLLVLFFHWHVADAYIGAVFGAMLQAMQTQRSPWQKQQPGLGQDVKQLLSTETKS